MSATKERPDASEPVVFVLPVGYDPEQDGDGGKLAVDAFLDYEEMPTNIRLERLFPDQDVWAAVATWELTS